MSGQHTPGPWFIDEAGVCSADRMVALIALSDEFLGCADEEIPDDARAEMDANAHLIAAAPALYEALAGATVHLEYAQDAYMAKQGVKDSALAALINTARAALSLARGEKA